jgi:hypothetical protein
MDYLLVESQVSITDLKKNPSAIIREADGSLMAILKQ